MDIRIKIMEIQDRAERFKKGNGEEAVTLVRFDLPFLTNLIADMNTKMDNLCRDNTRLKAENAELRHLRIRPATEDLVCVAD